MLHARRRIGKWRPRTPQMIGSNVVVWWIGRRTAQRSSSSKSMTGRLIASALDLFKCSIDGQLMAPHVGAACAPGKPEHPLKLTPAAQVRRLSMEAVPLACLSSLARRPPAAHIRSKHQRRLRWVPNFLGESLAATLRYPSFSKSTADGSHPMPSPAMLDFASILGSVRHFEKLLRDLMMRLLTQCSIFPYLVPHAGGMWRRPISQILQHAAAK